MNLLLALLLAPGLAAGQKPSQGKVRMHVSAGEAGVYKGLQQRTPDLEETAKDVRRHLGKSKWVEVTQDIDKADIRLVILGRRIDPDKGVAIGYSLDAGAYKSEDEFFDSGQSATVMGGAARDVRAGTDTTAQKSTAKFEDLPPQLADSLSVFCESNYDRIVSQRK